MDYQENLRQRAIDLKRIWEGNGWEAVAAKAFEWAAETAHAINGPQLSKGIIDAMLHELGVIPEIPKR